jgi:hypothetical protein
MTPSWATQERSAPRDFRTVTGMMGSDTTLSSMKTNSGRRRPEMTIGIQRTLGNERPKRKKMIVAVCRSQ